MSHHPYAHPTAVIDGGEWKSIAGVPTLIDPNIGEGTKIWHFCHVMKGAKIGKNCVLGQNVFVAATARIGDNVKIQNNVSIYDGVVLEDDVFVGPSAVFTNVINPRSAILRKDEYRPTVVRKGATIGANATIVCGNTLGRHCFIAAGAVVTRDVGDFELMARVPAENKGYMCICGVRMSIAWEPEPGVGNARCGVCKREYRLDRFCDGPPWSLREVGP